MSFERGVYLKPAFIGHLKMRSCPLAFVSMLFHGCCYNRELPKLAEKWGGVQPKDQNTHLGGTLVRYLIHFNRDFLMQSKKKD